MSLTIIKFEQDEPCEVYDSLDKVGDISPGVQVWVDIETDSIAELTSVASFFGFHELTVEDCLTAGHFPKLDDYGAYLFMILRGFKPWSEVEEIWESEDEDEVLDKEDANHLFTRKVAIYLSQNFIVTHRRKEIAWLDAIVRQVQQNPERLLQDGTEGIAHRVIDVLVDRFMRGMVFFDNIIDTFEDLALADSEHFEVTDLFEVKRELSFLRQIARNQRALLGRLSTDPTLIQDNQRRRYFKDIDDHAVAILRMLDKQIQAVMSIRDSYLALANVRLGDTMRILTVITTIAAPMNIVVGLYGMNFDAIPLLHSRLGFWVILVLMVLVAIAMLAFFRKRKWI
ncbi:MAG: magnesium transporter CorA family protein [Bdellovibrionales bacterium]|nr:magnesium transporter CorA family protein [Bdellovibrionales bacterium]